MHNYDLIPSEDGEPYRVHDLVADIFDLDISDAQADRLLQLCGLPVLGAGQDAIIIFVDAICNFFVGRGFPWCKERVDDEKWFWSGIKSCRPDFLAYINKADFQDSGNSVSGQ